jgi:hypothetical protein
MSLYLGRKGVWVLLDGLMVVVVVVLLLRLSSTMETIASVLRDKNIDPDRLVTGRWLN